MNILSFLVFLLVAFLVCRGSFKKQVGGSNAKYIIVGVGFLSLIGAGVSLYIYMNNDSSPTPSPPATPTTITDSGEPDSHPVTGSNTGTNHTVTTHPTGTNHTVTNHTGTTHTGSNTGGHPRKTHTGTTNPGTNNTGTTHTGSNTGGHPGKTHTNTPSPTPLPPTNTPTNTTTNTPTNTTTNTPSAQTPSVTTTVTTTTPAKCDCIHDSSPQHPSASPTCKMWTGGTPSLINASTGEYVNGVYTYREKCTGITTQEECENRGPSPRPSNVENYCEWKFPKPCNRTDVFNEIQDKCCTGTSNCAHGDGTPNPCSLECYRTIQKSWNDCGSVLGAAEDITLIQSSLTSCRTQLAHAQNPPNPPQNTPQNTLPACGTQNDFLNTMHNMFSTCCHDSSCIDGKPSSSCNDECKRYIRSARTSCNAHDGWLSKPAGSKDQLTFTTGIQDCLND